MAGIIKSSLLLLLVVPGSFAAVHGLLGRSHSDVRLARRGEASETQKVLKFDDVKTISHLPKSAPDPNIVTDITLGGGTWPKAVQRLCSWRERISDDKKDCKGPDKVILPRFLQLFHWNA